MILCFDIGNTDIDVGIFDNDVHVRDFRIPYQKDRTCWGHLGNILKVLQTEGIKPENVAGSILCSVVPGATQSVYEAMEIAFSHKPLLFENNRELTGINIKIDDPAQVGPDIIAGCMTVKEKYSLPAIVVDMGTGTTLTAMDADGSILGVSIMTGVVACLQTLNRRTGLPVDLSLTPPAKAIGTNTADSIASGAVLGSVFMMDGMITAFENEMGTQCNVYATGGISKMIMPLCRHENVVDDDMLLDGLYIYYKRAKGL